MRIGVERGRGAKPDLKLGICGEHGGDQASVGFCHAARARLRLVLAFRVPLARLAAAQAALAEEGLGGSRRRLIAALGRALLAKWWLGAEGGAGRVIS